MSGPAAVPSESFGLSIGEATDESALLSGVGLNQPDGLLTLDRRLSALCRERGPLRAVLARIAARLVAARAWDPLGFARLPDYAVERLGLSARWVRSLALVGEALRVYPGLERALATGTLGWTKVRLLARLPRGEDEASWIALARTLTAEQLSKRVRAVDLGSLEAGALDEEAVGVVFEARCSPEVRWKWHGAKSVASRVAGHAVPSSEAAELIAAEVLSGLPGDQVWEEDGCDETGVSWGPPSEQEADTPTDADAPEDQGPDRPADPAWLGYGALEEFLVGLDDADAFELDDRLRRAVCMEQRLEARLGPLLATVWRHWLHLALGYRTREAYVRERLGMDPTRARALVRLEHAAAASDLFARAFRSGELSWVNAGLLVPLVQADPLGRFIGEWVAWAKQVTVRRLREDVEWALALEDTDPAAFRQTGGLPPEIRGDREIRAHTSEPGTDGLAVPAAPPAEPQPDREIGAAARRRAETCTVRFVAPADVVQLFRAVLCTVRRRIERRSGKLPTEGEALGVMLDYVFSCWGVGEKVPAEYRVFARDGWRCKVPGCTSMQNLHGHHIIFSSQGGSDDPSNRVSLCAFHHLRGIHAERIRCTGTAPDGLRWQIGLRPGHAPLATYGSGDRQEQGRVESGALR